MKIKKRQRQLILDTVYLGIVGALGARIFEFLLRLFQGIFLNRLAGYLPPGLPHEGGELHQVIGPHGLWLIPLAAALGGLISGILVFSLAPEAEGHGTDTAVKAFHRAGGLIRARVVPIKILASAITIGSGGAAGREGPTALISAGIGSLYGTWTKRSDGERRLLVLIGMAAGLSAIFRSPIGAAIFAIEVLYRDMEFEADALLYTLLGSIVAFSVNGIFVGWDPLFQFPPRLTVASFSGHAWYVLLGLACGIVGTALPLVFYGVRDLFKKIHLPPHFKPALGGLAVGLMALVLPEVLGGGYGWIQLAIDGQLAASLLVMLLFGKMIAFALTVSSGGSGGVFAPSLFVGAMLGGLLADVFHQPPAAFVVVGMAAVFGSAARVPMATLFMVMELTGGYHLLAPAALAVTLSYLVQARLSSSFRYASLYEAQVNRRSDSPAHRIEHLQTAVRILSESRSLDLRSIGHLNLLNLMESGVPIDLPDGKQLVLGTLRPESPCVKKSIEKGCLLNQNEDWEIVAVLRHEHLLLPHPNTVLAAEDQLLVLTSPKTFEDLRRHVIFP